MKVSLINYLGTLALISLPSTALSLPTEEEACEYFSGDVAMIGEQPQANAFLAGQREVTPFVKTSIELDRYASFIREWLIGYALPRQDGQIIVVGYISAREFCLVDIIDRRVISISLVDGPLKGGDKANEQGVLKYIHGVQEQTVEVGSKAHRGAY